MEVLLDHGADINKADHDGDTPIFLALVRQNYDCVSCLLKPKYKCDVQKRVSMKIGTTHNIFPF